MKECFGTIYPDITQFRFGRQLDGKVFRLRINTVGPFQRGQHLEADVEAWERCQQREFYRSCFDFSTGQFLMRQFAMQV